MVSVRTSRVGRLIDIHFCPKSRSVSLVDAVGDNSQFYG